MPNIESPSDENRDTFMWRFVHLEPALLRGLVVGFVMMLASFGVIVSPAIPDSFVTFLLLFGAIYQALWTRGAVTPNAKVVVTAPYPADRPDVVMPGEAITTAPHAVIVDAARTAPRRFL